MLAHRRVPALDIGKTNLKTSRYPPEGIPSPYSVVTGLCCYRTAHRHHSQFARFVALSQSPHEEVLSRVQEISWCHRVPTGEGHNANPVDSSDIPQGVARTHSIGHTVALARRLLHLVVCTNCCFAKFFACHRNEKMPTRADQGSSN